MSEVKGSQQRLAPRLAADTFTRMPTARLCSYKQTHDTGFAPNPFHGYCTLATCKPQIRLHKVVGDWIAGFTSRKLNGDRPGHERLIYLMQVSEKLPLEHYFADKRFNSKIPALNAKSAVKANGDNIYRWKDGAFVQVPNRSHQEKELRRDLSGKFARVGTLCAYCGPAPRETPHPGRPRGPLGQAAGGTWTPDPVRVQAFIDFVFRRGAGRHAHPTQWKTGDSTWKKDACG